VTSKLATCATKCVSVTASVLLTGAVSSDHKAQLNYLTSLSLGFTAAVIGSSLSFYLDLMYVFEEGHHISFVDRFPPS